MGYIMCAEYSWALDTDIMVCLNWFAGARDSWQAKYGTSAKEHSKERKLTYSKISSASVQVSCMTGEPFTGACVKLLAEAET